MAIAGIGLANTASHLGAAQRRFDEKAQQVVAASAALSDQAPDDQVPEVAQALVGMETEALVNQLLFATFRKQSELMSETADLVKPR